MNFRLRLALLYMKLLKHALPENEEIILAQLDMIARLIKIRLRREEKQ